MKQSAEFPYTVQTAAGKPVGSRRTEADARGLVRMLEKIVPKDGPYRVVFCATEDVKP